MKKQLGLCLLLIMAFITINTNVACASLTRWFSPSDGTAYCADNAYGEHRSFGFYGCEWTQYAVDEYDFADAWELEFRYNPMSDLVDPYCTSSWCSMPNAYFEDDDPDDASIGCHSPQSMTANYSYSGYMHFVPASGQPDVFAVEVESELGEDGGLLNDPIPVSYESAGYCNKASSISLQ